LVKRGVSKRGYNKWWGQYPLVGRGGWVKWVWVPFYPLYTPSLKPPSLYIK
jgi:hypothetical protein